MDHSTTKKGKYMDVNSYFGSCSICGYNGIFEKEAQSFREGYQCPSCKASLRFQGQASAILSTYSNEPSFSLKHLVNQVWFRSLSIYEPGAAGPFREMFSDFLDYENSFYWGDVDLGETKDGLQCQSLEDLTFDNDRFDLVISSDILARVRKPWAAFSEIFRVLKPGGYHIFSVPLHSPMPSITKYRVDTSTEKDLYTKEPLYHGDGKGGKSLVYTDFGADIITKLEELGYEVTCHKMPNQHIEIQKLITLITRKPADLS